MFKVTCIGFLPLTAPGILISSLAPNGVTLTSATLQGGDVVGNISATVVPSTSSGSAWLAGRGDAKYDLLQVMAGTGWLTLVQQIGMCCRRYCVYPCMHVYIHDVRQVILHFEMI